MNEYLICCGEASAWRWFTFTAGTVEAAIGRLPSGLARDVRRVYCNDVRLVKKSIVMDVWCRESSHPVQVPWTAERGDRP